MQDRRPTVAVWRSLWLPPSETFVRDHVRGLRRWDALTLGLYHEDRGLEVVPDVAPFVRHGLRAKLVGPMSRLGYPGLYDATIRRRRPELVHAHFGTGATEVLPVARRHGLPLVVTFHGHDVVRAPQEDPTGRYSRRLEAVFDYADLLLPVSHYIASRLVDLGAPSDKVRVHYLGIPLDGRAAPRQVEDDSREGLLFVGRLVPLKGVDDLLQAYAMLPTALRRATPFRIVGDGPERARLESMAAQVPDGDITFLGTRTPGEVRDLMGRTRVLGAPSKEVLPGDAEAFGLVLVEAALARAAVVSYASGGVPEAVIDGVTGLLAPEGDVAALAGHLQRVLQDPELATALGDAGHERVVEHFDAAHQIAVLEDLYDEVVAAHRPPRVEVTRG
ncbi:glycosyltransferase [Pedococcus sp. KACC 23699]|uniref:Glycosyltransferase n=1 Tax=Pedococcus sp. KACC 23699 TaxID=3149228 RepID=A0AAU7JW77_9MICO